MEELSSVSKKIFVAAGAGAGKTRNLVEHIAKTFILVNKQTGKPPRIVGTTFTRKAANEIKDRVAKYATNPENSLPEETQKDLFKFAYSECLNITTIHGVCLQLLMKKAFLLGYSPDIKIISSSRLYFFQRKILFETIKEENQEGIFNYIQFLDLLSLFEEMQVRQMDFDRPANLSDLEELYKGVLSEIKKESLTILDLDENLYQNISTRPEEVVIFIKQAKIALLESIKTNDLLPLKTFLDEIKVPGQNASKKSEPELFERFDAFKKTMRLFRDQYIEDKKYTQYFDKSNFSFVVDLNKTIYDLFIKYEKKLNQFKKQKSFVTMSEVEHLTLKLLKQFPKECQDFIDMWDFWYVDEYQDTSPIQSEIFKILLKDKPYYKVGDPQQSIYLFRGAKASIFIEEMDEAKKDINIEFRILNKNYRSHPNLMAGINEFFDHLGEQSKSLLESFATMEAKSEILDEHSKRFNITVVDSTEAEKQYVISEIKRLKQQGVELSQICVLAHNRKILSECEEEMAKNDIPCLAQFSGGLLDRPEIVGLICFLKVMDNPHLDIELIKILRTQFFKVEEDLLKQWCEDYKNNKSWSLWESLDHESHPVLDKIKHFLNIFKAKDYVKGLKAYFTQSDVLNSAYNPMDLARRNANLFKVYAFICQKSEITGYSLKSLIEDLQSGTIEELSTEAIFSQSKDGVRLFTIHGSKGLEFKYVFLIGSGNKRQLSYIDPIEVLHEKRIFLVPIKDFKKGETISTVLKHLSKEDRIFNEKKEARRVIYVAATRAEENLNVVGVASKNKKNEFSPRDESLFKVIDLNQFINKSWNHIGINVIDSEITNEVLEDLQEYQFLDFANNPKPETFDLDKKLFKKTTLEIPNVEQTSWKPMSVTALVEALGGSAITFKEIGRKEFKKIDFTKMYNSNSEKSKFHMEIFMKPFIGDVFHKTIELFGRGVSTEGLKDYLKSFFPDNAQEILNLIFSISEIKIPDMKTIFANANSEWGFNALYEENILLSGQIDMWGFDNKGVLHIFDYKTGSIKYLNKAVIQLGLYKQVLQKIYPKSEIQTHVIYPAEGLLVSVDVGDIKHLNP